MLATNGQRWFDRRTPDSSWSSFVVSVLLTLALFAAAFVAMRTVPPWITPATDREKPVVVRLEPPVRRAQPQPIPKRTVAPVRPAPVVAPVEQPTTPPVTVPIVTTPPTAPTGPERRDTVTSKAPRGTEPSAFAAPRGGAPMAPSGVTAEQFWRGSAMFRDSSRTIHVGELRPGVLTAPAADEEKRDIAERQRRAAMVARRATTAGSNEVHIPVGQGMSGEGATSSGGGVSVGLPLFSRGPSAAQRKKDEAIDADNRATLRRLQERIRQKRDSILADSIAKAKARIVPS